MHSPSYIYDPARGGLITNRGGVPRSISMRDAYLLGAAAADPNVAAAIGMYGIDRTPIRTSAAADLALSLQSYPRVVADLGYRSARIGSIEAADCARHVCGAVAPALDDVTWAEVLQRLAEHAETEPDRELILADALRDYPHSAASALAHDAIDPLPGYWSGLKRLGSVVDSEDIATALVDALLGDEAAR